MKVLKETTTLLVAGDRGLSARHWGFLAVILSGGGFTAITLTGKEFPLPGLILIIVMFSFGLFAAVFMKHRLTHTLNKETGKGIVSYPKLLDTKLERVEFSLKDVKSVGAKEQDPLMQALTRSSSMPIYNSSSHASAGFAYILSSGDPIEAGIYSSVAEEIEEVKKRISAFLGVPTT